MDGSQNSDWVNQKTDFEGYIAMLQSYGAEDIVLSFEGRDYDLKLLSDFSYQIPSISASER